MVIGLGTGQPAPFPMEGALPPDLEGTLFRVGPPDADQNDDVGELPGVLHAIELREGRAVSYLRRASPADAGVFWHGGSVLALPESGLPSQYSRQLAPEEFAGGMTARVASHTHRVAVDGSRVLFAVDDGEGREDGADTDGIFLRLGEWDARGGLQRAQSVALERATWQHDIGVTATHVVFIESPTARLRPGHHRGRGKVPPEGLDLVGSDGFPGRAPRVPFGWLPGAESWAAAVPRDGDGTAVQWHRLDPCLVTHVLGAWDEAGAAGRDPSIVLLVCRYDAPEAGQPIDRDVSVVGQGVGLSAIGGSLPVLERWRLTGELLERTVVDDRPVEYPRIDPCCEGDVFRYGYAIELEWGQANRDGGNGPAAGGEVVPTGLLKFDLDRDDTTSWRPGPFRTPSEPLFVRAADGRSDDEGWLLCLVEDHNRDATDVVVLDASSLGRRGPEAVIHLPMRLPLRAHGEWVPADRYR